MQSSTLYAISRKTERAKKNALPRCPFTQGEKKDQEEYPFPTFPLVSLRSVLSYWTYGDDQKFYMCIVQYGNTSHIELRNLELVTSAPTEMNLILTNLNRHM